MNNKIENMVNEIRNTLTKKYENVEEMTEKIQDIVFSYEEELKKVLEKYERDIIERNGKEHIFKLKNVSNIYFL